MKYKLYVILIFVMVLLSYGQSGAQTMVGSPYTVFGIGDIHGNSFGKYISLGGTGIAVRDPLSLNNINPASYTAIGQPFNSLAQLGFEFTFSDRKSGEISTSSTDSKLTGFNMWFRSGAKSAISLGLLPYSHVSYSLENEQNFSAVPGDFGVSYQGSGGLNKFYFGAAYVPLKNLSIGGNLSYIFGPISEEQNIEASAYNDNIVISKYLSLNSLNIDLGVQYVVPINESQITLGAIYDYQNNLNGNNQVEIFENGTEGTVLIENYESKEDDYILPETYGLGIAYRHKQKWLLTTDFKVERWSKADFMENYELRDSRRYSGGFSYLPNAKPVTYFQTIGFDVGAFYEQTYLLINDSGVDKYGFSCGINIPVSSVILNLSYEYSKRNAVGKKLIMENYNKLTLNLSLMDIWFRRYKSD